MPSIHHRKHTLGSYGDSIYLRQPTCNHVRKQSRSQWRPGEVSPNNNQRQLPLGGQHRSIQNARIKFYSSFLTVKADLRSFGAVEDPVRTLWVQGCGLWHPDTALSGRYGGKPVSKTQGPMFNGHSGLGELWTFGLLEREWRFFADNCCFCWY